MVSLNFNLLGFAFQQGVNWLETGFATAALALRAQFENRESDLEAYKAHVAAGGERIGEWEDGLTLWEQDDILAIHIDDAEEALMDLRKAYVMAAYHHWERSARRWTRAGPHAKHAKLVSATVALGYPLSGQLTGLHDLVNTLKHNSARWAAALASSWPEVLTADPAAMPEQDWYRAVELTDAHVHQACEIIRRSGPDAERLPGAHPGSP
jgi:hypothetical protein